MTTTSPGLASTGVKRVIARLPLLDWLLEYRKEWLRHDLVAGLTTAAVVIPKAMAYASVAGLPIQVGLYTALVPMITYGMLGTSRPLSVSTTTTLAILTGAELGEVVPEGQVAALLQATALLTVMVGVILILASVLRLGFVANFISEPVLVGFKAGIAVVIAATGVGGDGVARWTEPRRPRRGPAIPIGRGSGSRARAAEPRDRGREIWALVPGHEVRST